MAVVSFRLSARRSCGRMTITSPCKWFVRFHPNGDPEQFIVQAEKQPGQPYAQEIMEHSFYPTKLADAKLIAAAPMMLALLKRCAIVLPIGDGLLNEIDEAIAASEGVESK